MRIGHSLYGGERDGGKTERRKKRSPKVQPPITYLDGESLRQGSGSVAAFDIRQEGTRRTQCRFKETFLYLYHITSDPYPTFLMFRIYPLLIRHCNIPNNIPSSPSLKPKHLLLDFLLISEQVQMANQWTTPPTDRQGHQVAQSYACRMFKCSSRCFVIQIPPTPEYPGAAFQPNMPTYQRDEYPNFQNCHCAQCFAMRSAEAEPSNWYPVEQQDQSYSGVSGLMVTMAPHS